MSESSGVSLPGFGSEKIHNLPITEIVMGTVELPQDIMTQTNAGPTEVSNRQVITIAPSLDDSQAASIRDLIHKELWSSLGRSSFPSERKDNTSFPSSQEDFC